MDRTNLLLVLHEQKQWCQFNELGREQFGLYKYANLRIIWSTSPFETVNRGHGTQVQILYKYRYKYKYSYKYYTIIQICALPDLHLHLKHKLWQYHTNTSQKFWKWWIITMDNLTVKVCWEIITNVKLASHVMISKG